MAQRAQSSNAAVALALVVALAPLAAAAKGRAAAPKVEEPVPPVPPPEGLAAAREKLVMLGDGHGHFLALVPFPTSDQRKQTYYGDGKRMNALRVTGGGASGDEWFSLTFHDPRYLRGVESELRFRNGKYVVSCGPRQTELGPLPAEESRKQIAEAELGGPLWRWSPYALARDERGTYFYVDRPRTPADSRSFRLFSGPRGKLKQLDMLNVVSDSVGEIFVTRTGKFWLVFGKDQSFWLSGKTTKRPLTNVPVEDNGPMIYDEVGVYAGQRLGTPCDDL